MQEHREEQFANEQYLLHEQRTNKVVGLLSLAMAGTCFLSQTLFVLDDAINVSAINRAIFIPISILLIISYCIARRYEFKYSWIKYMLIGGITLIGIGLFFCYSLYASYFVLLPIIISTRYFNRKFVLNVSIVTAVLVDLACLINATVGKTWYILMFNHYTENYSVWDYPTDIIVFIVVPLGLIVIFVAAYSTDMTHQGRKILVEQARVAYKMNAVENELNMAATIQRNALPDENYTSPNGKFVIRANELPAKVVGGDFYDYFMLDEHRLAFLVADVSDKGVPAAMFMMSAKRAIRYAVEFSDNIEIAVAVANRLLCEDNSEDMFLTMWIAIIDTRTGEGEYINAGHTKPAIKSKDGSIRWVENKPDMLVGCFDIIRANAHSISLAEGDTIILYTDGISESMNVDGDYFGMQRIGLALENCEPGADNTVEAVMGEAIAFSEGRDQFDDMTVLALHHVSEEQVRE